MNGSDGLSFEGSTVLSCRNGVIAAVALIGLATFDAASEATANIDSTDAAYCHWYLQKAG
jgi:hypothetical protein